MGSLFDGYETARMRQEALLAERHRKEEDVDQHLRTLDGLLDQDKAFMSQHGIAHEVAHRVLHVNHNRSPVITVHYDSDQPLYRVTYMGDGTQATGATADEAATAIGEMLFKVLTK